MRRRAVEDVSAVDDEIDVAREGRCKRRRIVREEVESASAPPHARSNRQVDPEMGVGKKKESDRVRHLYMVYASVFIRQRQGIAGPIEVRTTPSKISKEDRRQQASSAR